MFCERAVEYCVIEIYMQQCSCRKKGPQYDSVNLHLHLSHTRFVNFLINNFNKTDTLLNIYFSVTCIVRRKSLEILRESSLNSERVIIKVLVIVFTSGNAYKITCNRLSQATWKVEPQKREQQPKIVLSEASLTAFWYLRDWKRHTALTNHTRNSLNCFVIFSVLKNRGCILYLDNQAVKMC